MGLNCLVALIQCQKKIWKDIGNTKLNGKVFLLVCDVRSCKIIASACNPKSFTIDFLSLLLFLLLSGVFGRTKGSFLALFGVLLCQAHFIIILGHIGKNLWNKCLEHLLFRTHMAILCHSFVSAFGGTAKIFL